LKSISSYMTRRRSKRRSSRCRYSRMSRWLRRSWKTFEEGRAKGRGQHPMACLIRYTFLLSLSCISFFSLFFITPPLSVSFPRTILMPLGSQPGRKRDHRPTRKLRLTSLIHVDKLDSCGRQIGLYFILLSPSLYIIVLLSFFPICLSVPTVSSPTHAAFPSSSVE
jgi:hypothetical protein